MLIKQMIKETEVLAGSENLIVETDDSAVGFYKQCGNLIYSTKTLDKGIVRYQLKRRCK